jgi:hypothetical protein
MDWNEVGVCLTFRSGDGKGISLPDWSVIIRLYLSSSSSPK